LLWYRLIWYISFVRLSYVFYQKGESPATLPVFPPEAAGDHSYVT